MLMKNTTRSNSNASRTSKAKKKAKEVDWLQVTQTGIEAVDSVTNAIKTIGEERRKTQELVLEGIKIRSDIEDKINQRENDTAKVLKDYEIQLKKIEQEMKSNEWKKDESISQLEFQKQQSRQDHEYRMKICEMIEKIIDVAIDQYKYYRNEPIFCEQNNTYVINIDLLTTMNDTIQKLTATIAQANLYLPAPFEEE